MHDDYRPVPPSPRHQAADDMAAWVRDSTLGLPPVKGIQPRRDHQGRYYAIDWGQQEEAHGTVYVYGSTYFKVWYHTTRPGLPLNDTRLFAALEEVMAFLSLAFIDDKPEQALAIPQRQPKKRKGKDDATEPPA